MTIGNFTENILTPEDDNVTLEDLTVNYALAGNDLLITGDRTISFLVGGSGDDSYYIYPFAGAYIQENGNDDGDALVAFDFIFSDNSSASIIADVDNRHLLLYNGDQNQSILIVDWQVPENQIEFFIFGNEVTLSYNDFINTYQNANNYIGNIFLEQNFNIIFPPTADTGLTTQNIESSLATIATKAIELEFSGNNPPQVSEEIPDQSATVNSEFTYTISENSFTDADGDQLTYTVENLPTWLTFNGETLTFSGMPTESETLVITVTVSDGQDSVSDTFNLTINEENQTIFAPVTINSNYFSGGGNDTIDNSSSTNNRVYSQSGNDIILAGENDRIFGGEGDDILDASQGNGSNLLFGGKGNDTLIAGNGNDVLVGGEGADKFTIADSNLPENYNLILDFETEDTIVIKDLGITFEDISIINREKGAELIINEKAIAIFPELDAGILNNSNNFEIS